MLWRFPNLMIDHQNVQDFKEGIKKAIKEVVEESPGASNALLWQTMRGKFRQVMRQFCKANKSSRSYEVVHIHTVEKYLEKNIKQRDKSAPEVSDHLEKKYFMP